MHGKWKPIDYRESILQEHEDENLELFEGERELTTNFITLLHTSIETYAQREATREEIP